MGLLKNSIVYSIYVALVCSVGIAQANVVVESRDEQWQNTSQTLLRVRVFNDSQDTLKNIELHYFLSPRERPIILDKYHPQNLDARIDTSSSKISILKISLPELPPGIFPDSGGLALGLHFSDWNTFGKSSDFSAPRSEDYHATGKIAVYAEGTFLCGFLPGTLPNASPISLGSGSEVSIGPGEHVHFAWREVDNASSYRLNVLSASDSTIVLQTATDKNRVDAELETGEYLWNVESSEYGSESAFWDGKLFRTDTPYKLTVLADTTYFILKALDVPPLSARKDTRLLDLKWGEMALAREWDKPHPYAVNIGRGAEVRRIESKGGIFLRDYARVTGNIKIYSLPEKNWTLTTQNNVKFTRASFSTLKSLWPYRIAELSTMPPAGDSIADVVYGKSLTLKNGDRIKTLKVHPGGTLFIAPGEMHAENIQLESGSKVQFISPGQRTVLHLNGSVIWRARNQNEDMEQVAKGFMLVQHGSETMTVEGMWAGTIFAPNANLILGQSNKKLYGRFLGKDITVHQYATVYSVNFNPEITTEFVWRKK